MREALARQAARVRQTISDPPNSIAPLSGTSRRTMHRAKVDLPEPLSPTTPSVVPWVSESVMLRKAAVYRPRRRNVLLRLVICSTAGAADAGRAGGGCSEGTAAIRSRV